MQKQLFFIFGLLLVSVSGIQAQLVQAKFIGPGLGVVGNAPCGVPVSYTLDRVAQQGGHSNVSVRDAINCIAANIDGLSIENGTFVSFDSWTGVLTVIWNCAPCFPNSSYNSGAISDGGNEFDCGDFDLLIEEAVRVECVPPTGSGPCLVEECLRLTCKPGCWVLYVNFTNGSIQNYTIITNSNTQTICFAPGLQIASYYFTLCDLRPSDGTSNEIEEDISNAPELLVYPSPSAELVNIAVNGVFSGKAELRLFNSLGMEVMHRSMEQNTISLEVGALPNGVFVVKVDTGTGSYTSKVLISRI